MDSFEFTKIAGAVLSALLLIFGTKTIIEMNVGHHGAEHAGYTLPAPEAAAPAAPAAEGAEAAPAANFADLLAKATPDAGKGVFSKCKACHSADKGAANGVGPNLWGVVGRKKGSSDGFGYTDAMKNKGGEWTFDELSAFLTNPKSVVPGTKMVFAGLAKPEDRANLISYLNAQSDAPLPAPAAATPSAPAKPPAAPAPAAASAPTAAPAPPAPAPAPAATATPPAATAPSAPAAAPAPPAAATPSAPAAAPAPPAAATPSAPATPPEPAK